MADPNCHTLNRQIINSAYLGSDSQSTPATPNMDRIMLIIPSPLKMAFHSTAIATEPPRIDGI